MGVDKENVLELSYRNRAYEFETDPNYRKENDPGTEDSVPNRKRTTDDATHVENELTTPNDVTGSQSSNEVNVNSAMEKEEDDEIPDGGWGWIVAFGGFLGEMMVNMVSPCFGILYSEFLLNLGTSAVFTSWIYNLMGFMMTMAGIFLNALVEEFGFRTTAYVGTIMIFAGILSTAFADSPWLLLVSFSLVTGTGNGIIACLAYSIVPHYFKKRLGVANAIMSSGVSIGQAVGPVIITQLQNEFAYKGAIIVLSGIILHCCIGATAFHPREWHLKNPRAEAKKLDSPGGFKLAFRILKTTLKTLTLMKSPVALIVALGGTFNVIGYLNFLTIMPFAMQEAGFSVEDAAAGLTISGITNLATRLCVSVMTDLPNFNMRLFFMFGTLLTVALSVAFCFLNDLTSIQVVMGFWGLGVGIYMGLFNLIMVKYVGREKLMAEIGLTSFTSSVWFLSCGPLLGAIRDSTGSYSASIYTLAGTIFITFILYSFLPAAIAYEERKAQRMKEQERSQE
ncbi:monocarboxylate transporter 12-like [Palaemon carinicauda]|uniref:monocarboxylate transporter 12-like n=1 Tax=Palaemon carinicauda TaxID=392227 RepID=UPI0035B63939